MTKIETSDDLEKVVTDQNQALKEMADLLKAMDAKLRTYVKLVDIHQAALERFGIMRPKSPGGSLANN